jgi:glutamyl-tRNA synthetase
MALILKFPKASPPLTSLLTLKIATGAPVPKLVASPNLPEGTPAELIFPSTGNIMKGDHIIARYFGRTDSKAALLPQDPLQATEVDEWLQFAQALQSADGDAAVALLEKLNLHLTMRSFFVGFGLSLADLGIWAAITSKRLSSPASAVHLERLLNYLETLETIQALKKEYAIANKEEAKAGPVKSTGKYPPLEGAVQGKVVTRFPPEPSGYLHIGHAKAALLNEHYARHYGGTLILRFDDTNPAKEKQEYIDSIRRDLNVLGIKFDKVTYTSDYFAELEKVAVKLLKEGKAYIDTSTADAIKAQRLALDPSPCRDQDVAKNLELWEEMREGTEQGLKCVLRAKIDYKNPNGVLRDPNLYRCNLTPHHRQGAKYKVYPTYDLACPIVDSIEGVTHSLRSSEYHDRNHLWDWVLKAAEVRYVRIQDFSRLAFSYTLLSKRKLQWFVDKAKVEGWNDPSFPTISGLLRHGLTVEALRELVIAQGASKSIVLMDIEKLWTLNKQVIDPKVPRYIAVNRDAVTMKLTNAPAPHFKSQPRHRKNNALGTKMVAYAQEILLDVADAVELAKGEEITLMYWGNAIVKEIQKDSAGKITHVVGELHLEGDPKNTAKKLHWLAKSDELVSVSLCDIGNLITKPSLDKEEKLEPFVNPTIKTYTDGLGDASLRALNKGDMLQLERKGYYIVDRALGTDDKPLLLIRVPDGHRAH